MNIGKNISNYRKSRGYTQEELAEKCEVSRQAVTKWESGLCYPDVDKLCILAKLFDCSLDELVNEEMKIKDSKELFFEKIKNNYYESLFKYSIAESHLDFAISNYQSINGYNMAIMVQEDLLSSFYKFLCPENSKEVLSVDNTNIEERKIIADLFGCKGYTSRGEDDYKYFNSYVYGECELDSVINQRLEYLRHRRIVNKLNTKKEIYDLYCSSRDYLKKALGEIYVNEYVKKASESLMKVKEIDDNIYLKEMLYNFGKDLQDIYENSDKKSASDMLTILGLLELTIWKVSSST